MNITCLRCGRTHETDDEDAVDFAKEDGCSHCEDWVECDHCSKWHEPDESTEVVHSGSSENWCRDCRRSSAWYCDHCERWFYDETFTSVYTSSGTEEWCTSCLRSGAFECQVCGDCYPDSSDSSEYHRGGFVCESCRDDDSTTSYCDSCNSYRAVGDRCDCGSSESSSGSTVRNSGHWNVRGYGAHGSFSLTNEFATKLYSPPAIGLEMEVGNFPSSSLRGGFGENVFAPLLGEEFAYPTSDSSLGPCGIEFIGHPMGVLDHINAYGKYNDFFGGLALYKATVSENPSGCHTNFSKDCFVGPDAIRAAIIVCVRFYDALMMFTDPATKRRRMGYCKKADLRSGIDPLVQCKSSGKYSIVNIKDHEGPGIVEFRLAGMCLDNERFLAQIQLYHNLVAWANKNAASPEKAGWDTFDEIFLPVMFQGKIEDVIKKGRITAQLPLGDPYLSDGKRSESEMYGAIGYVVNVGLRSDSYDICRRFSCKTEFDEPVNVFPGDLVVERSSSKWMVVTKPGFFRPEGVDIYRLPVLSAHKSCSFNREFGYASYGCAVRYFIEGDTFSFKIHGGTENEERFQRDLATIPSTL